MSALPNVNMHAVTRLTREGRLADAMAMLRGEVSGRAATEPKIDDPAGTGTARLALSTVDMVPPSRIGGVWAAPKFTAPASSSRPGHSGAEKSDLSDSTDMMSSFLDRVRKLGSKPGLGGLPGSLQARPKAPMPEGARFEERSFTNEAGTRGYKLYVPSSYEGEPVALIVMLHGCTQSPEDFAAGTRMNEIAEEERFLVAYPAQTQAANASRCWNWFSVDDQQRDRGEPSLIAGITQQIMRDYCIDPARVYIAGLSAGGAAAATMGSVYPDLYVAVGVHSGLACGAAKDMASAFTAMRNGGTLQAKSGFGRFGGQRPAPTIVFHGDGDKTVHPVNADQIIAQSGAGTNLQTTTFQGVAAGGMTFTRSVLSDEAGCPILEKWTLHGAGHAWSGGSEAGSYTDSRGPDASREMLRFFFQHSNVASMPIAGF